MPTLCHILLRDEIKYSSVVLYFSDLNLFYSLTLPSLSLRFVPSTAKPVTSSEPIPDVEGCCSQARGDATPSCRRAETAARNTALSAHTFTLQAAVRVITFNSARNETKLQTSTGWMKDEITCLTNQTEFSSGSVEEQEQLSRSLPCSKAGEAIWQSWNPVNELLYRENGVWFPFTQP